MLNKKKILLFTDWYEPGYKAGGPIQSCRNFVMAMQDSFRIFIITADRDLGDQGPYPGIIPDEWTKKNEDLEIYYAREQDLTINKIKHLISFINPDHIYLNSMYSYRFTIIPLYLKLTKQFNAKVIVAPRGMLQRGAMEFKSLKKKIFIRLLNLTRIPRKLIFHATDEQEKNDIREYFPLAGQISVIANFPRKHTSAWNRLEKKPGDLHCVYISRVSPKKNLLFLLDILQQLPAGINLRLTIRGEIEDDRYWKKCLSAIDALPSNIAANWEGPVPNHIVEEVLETHHLFVLPTKGENFGHAIFEALLSGKPVLISDQTPWRNLAEKKTGWDLPLDQPSLFRQAIEQAASFNQQEYDEWSYSAWKYARDYTEKSNFKEAYLNLFN